MARKKDLPIEIVELIIAMMPYPSIFKCRCLSKSWLARFASISSQADEAEKGRAMSFQKQVGERSNSWKTLCPVFPRNDRDFVAYDRVCHMLRRLPSLPVPEMNLSWKWGQGHTIQIEGALVYAFDPYSIESEKYIANILTGAWKQLPACPLVDQMVITEKLVSYASSEVYKVVLLCRGRGQFRESVDVGQHELYAQIYESKLDAWSVKKVVFSCAVKTYFFDSESHHSTVYLNGVFYFDGFQVNFKEGTSEELVMQPAEHFHSEIISSRMEVSGNGNLLLVSRIISRLPFFIETGLRVRKFDFQSQQLSELADCSFAALDIESSNLNLQPVCDGNSIFLGVVFGDTRSLTYDVDKNEWSYLPIPGLTSYRQWDYQWLGSVFQPGLNPFAAV